MDLKRSLGWIASSKSIVFDLDGTLIDSQESIITAIKIALHESGLEAKMPVTKDVIGPPLVETIAKITGIKNQLALNEIAIKFKLHYDSVSYRDAVVYPGIQHILESLKNNGYALYIATNKRLVPTKKIVDYLSWGSLFTAVYSIDLNSKKIFKNKAELISELLNNEPIDPKFAIYIGDRYEDYEAARKNGLSCILVGWGYGSKMPTFSNKNFFVNNHIELLNTIQKIL